MLVPDFSIHAGNGTGYRLIGRGDDGYSAARGDTIEAIWSESLWFAGRVQRGQALPVDA